MSLIHVSLEGKRYTVSKWLMVEETRLRPIERRDVGVHDACNSSESEIMDVSEISTHLDLHGERACRRDPDAIIWSCGIVHSSAQNQYLVNISHRVQQFVWRQISLTPDSKPVCNFVIFCGSCSPHPATLRLVYRRDRKYVSKR